ncbi:PTS sugar transporter subunit IIA [Streptococcus orisasini]|uniref:PTS sugar transporter subunit IIA n=1 Tax=Streptococcus orisasini TaxID=1080071 RepID=UPI000710EFA4|nr:PTS sugar transporter subunit IIA [Streptococcus orisasini]
MLEELLTADYIRIKSRAKNWEEAIQWAAEPLLNGHKIEARYIEAMIDKVKEFGPFINIGDHLALPHARPEDGVLEKGLSLLKLEQPVDLLDDPKRPISVFICLAASDDRAHLEALKELTRLLSQKENLQKLIQASTVEAISSLLAGGGKQ